MSTVNTTITTSQTYTFPSTMIAGSVSFTAQGGDGGLNSASDSGGAGAYIAGEAPSAVAGDAWIITIGADGGTGTGGAGAGFHAGGAGAHNSSTGLNSGGGGGSTAIQKGATVLVEAAGGGGQGDSGSFASQTLGAAAYANTLTGQVGGGGLHSPGTFNNNAGGGGATVTSDGSGGTASGGTAGSAGSSGVGGAGGAGTANSGAGGGGGGGHKGGGGGGGGATGGTGGGGGGGAGACYTDSSITVNTIEPASSGFPSVSLSYTIIDAPPSPTLYQPGNSSYADPFGAGITFSAFYNQGSTGDVGVLEQVALRLSKDGGAYGYWDGTDFTTSTPVWFVPTTGVGDANGSLFTQVIPAGVIVDTHTYTWSFACREANAGIEGSFASDFLFTAAAMPTAVITAPIGTIETITPNFTWTETLGGGDAQIAYRVMIYSTPSTPGSSGAVYDSGVVSSALLYAAIPSNSGIENGNTYYGYLQITETGNLTSAWASTTFSLSLVGPSAPTIVVTQITDPTTGMPEPQISATQTDSNLISLIDDSNFANSLGQWFVESTNATLSQTTADGTTAMLVTAN